MFVLIRSLTESDSHMHMQRDKTASERVCHFTFSGPTVNGLGTTSCRVGNETVRVGWVISSVPEYVIKLEDVHHAHVDATNSCEERPDAAPHGRENTASSDVTVHQRSLDVDRINVSVSHLSGEPTPAYHCTVRPPDYFGLLAPPQKYTT